MPGATTSAAPPPTWDRGPSWGWALGEGVLLVELQRVGPPETEPEAVGAPGPPPWASVYSSVKQDNSSAR